MAHWWNLAPTAALAKGIKQFGANVLVEAGPMIINELIAQRALDGIYLSVTGVLGGENKIDISELLKNFEEITTQEIEGTQFIEARNLVKLKS